MRYVDVILPRPLDGFFTYAISSDMSSGVKLGIRVLVPFGASKTCTAMVVRMHDDKPAFETKQVLQVVDAMPMLLPQQLDLWKWIAQYYMAPIGDVYTAALPAGLKDDEGWQPKTEVYVALSDNFQNDKALAIALDMLKNATQQLKAFTHFLHLSHWDTIENNLTQLPVAEITRVELMNVSGASSAIIKALINRGLLREYHKEVGRLNNSDAEPSEKPKPLSQAQQEAYNNIVFQFLKKRVVLLHGVTSSGKTEVYIHLINKALKEKKQVLYLLPEIALTVQMTSRLKRVFGNKLGIYHSRYSDAERVEIWKKQLSTSPYEVILGARSAVFLPFQRLGLVIIDEEHEGSFKQQDPAPRYHARSAAIMLASYYGAQTLLGTATPSTESFFNAQTGKYGLVQLQTRYNDIALPEIKVVDVKDLRRRKMMNGPFSPALLAAVRTALEHGEQVILFQNRRGFAPMVECHTCGWVPKCDNCDVSLTLHKNMNQLSCHYCGFTYAVPSQCPNCNETNLRGRGYGTEKVEDLFEQLFPDAKIARMDLDTTRTKNAYERIIQDFSLGKTNVLIGTQMVTKGLDFDKVSVVGILNADAMLNYPDFRAYEQAFTMMAQVSGRAGRKGKRGLVLLQTTSPELPVIGQVVRNDYQAFYTDLLEERRLFKYPPFYRLVYIYLKHSKEQVAETAGIELGSRLRQFFSDRLLGPDKPAVARIKSLHIRKLVLKLEPSLSGEQVRQCLHYAHKEMMKDKKYATLHVFYDVDPL
ncbi:replication restart helicase PriA [Hoylesella shahii]|uniref:Replication restart protein PriA n=1 Tax=Hoylesella shahii DSM 15611 = JCM 12083 TaxID=1122991 RepID=A0A318HTV8_9BACT|nr:primosomal protein N' [Hoylesella shahii]PXX21858.1 replication restart DNA helicase PriA [Hoylesella shahii DSM 15611 = JCM 12083]